MGVWGWRGNASCPWLHAPWRQRRQKCGAPPRCPPCRGNGANGRMGDGGTTTRISPVLVGTASSTWADISSGTAHTCGVMSNGTLYCCQCWGRDEGWDDTRASLPGGAALPPHPHLIFPPARAGGLNTAYQLGDGTATQSLYPKRIGTAANWATVAVSIASSTALTTTGALYVWVSLCCASAPPTPWGVQRPAPEGGWGV